jgi:hypothetical protein
MPNGQLFPSCCTTLDHGIGIYGETWCTKATGQRCLDGYSPSTIPQTDLWSANAVTHSMQKLEEACQSFWYRLLPSFCVNRKITKEYIMLPLWHQGVALPNLNIDVLSKIIHLLQLHWDTGSTSGRMLHQAYQVFQIEVGLGGNIFPRSFVAFCRFATHSFFQNLWELPHRYGVVFCIHGNFNILLLWEHDHTLMDAVHDTGIFDRHEQETLNRYWHYKGVHSMGDLVCSDGRTIDPILLTEEAEQSSREFPLQFLTGPDHKLWLKMTHSLTQTGGHELRHPLGRYISIPHRPDVWFGSKTVSSLFLKVDTGGHDI